jgi:hypothetical protein
MKSPTGTKKKEVAGTMEPYQLVLKFNEKAELTTVEYPENMTLAMANNHVAVAVLALAQWLVEAEKDLVAKGSRLGGLADELKAKMDG